MADEKRGWEMRQVSYQRFGEPERITPLRFKPRTEAAERGVPARLDGAIVFRTTGRGCVIELPMAPEEEIFGFGLQLKGFRHRGSKKCIRPNADPVADTGDSHAPVPFYVTNQGYGVYVDTARYASFYCGRSRPGAAADTRPGGPATDTESLYAADHRGGADWMVIDIPAAKGVDLYFFEGKTITEIVAAYNRFSGGGCLPPMWGLGVLYRCCARYGRDEVIRLARGLRESRIPCDCIGLEPGWQSRSYSCSFVWDPERFPRPESFIREIRSMGYRLSLWEHAFVHPESPLRAGLDGRCGNYTVWGGLTPDFADPAARSVFADYHRRELVGKGISCFKLDECDGSDYTNGWSFPDCTDFPSGIDGERMHSLFGVLYQQAVLEALGGEPALGQVRSSGAFAASYPFVLYSDLYQHSDFIRGCASAGFGGLLWAPELREAESKEELLRRLQTAVFSAQVVINAWYLEQPPWIPLGAEEEVRALLEVRMSLLPYLLTAFYRYREEGVPPVRALVSDFTQDRETFAVDDEYLLGDSLLAAPMTAGQEERRVYLPGGEWYDFWDHRRMEAGWHTVRSGSIPVYVRAGTLLPLAEPVQCVREETTLRVTLWCAGARGAGVLYDERTGIAWSMDGNTQPGRYGRYQITGVRRFEG